MRIYERTGMHCTQAYKHGYAFLNEYTCTRTNNVQFIHLHTDRHIHVKIYTLQRYARFFFFFFYIQLPDEICATCIQNLTIGFNNPFVSRIAVLH